MDYRPKDDGRSGTFGKSLLQQIQSKLPYNGFNVLNPTDVNNPKYKFFERTGERRAEVLNKHSVVASNPYNDMGIGEIAGDRNFSQVMYAQIQRDKPARLRDYRVIAAYPRVVDALDEICDETINKDYEGKHAKLMLSEIRLDGENTELIQHEFEKFINIFDFDNKGWQYFRDWLVEGEIYFEHIIHKDHTDKGILGVVRIPSELIDPIYNNIQNMVVKGFIYRKPIMNPNDPTKIEKYDYIPLETNQVAYIHSGIWNESKTMILPFLENARRPYRQLSLIEDAIVIYRLVRAPSRLVFNVDVGNMAPPKAESYLRKLIQQYWSSKTFDINSNEVTQKFSPQSMMDAFWFAKRTGSEGTSVTQLSEGQSLGQLEDLHFFLSSLYQSLKVPVNRLNPESAFQGGESILREELKFAKFIVRLQQRFAAAIKKSFIVHLQLRGIWDELNLKEQHINIEFNPPTNFFELREAQRLELKVNNFNTITQNEFVSKWYAQKRYLGWSDKDILANKEFLKKEKEFTWELQQIEALGPNWKAQLLAGAQPGQGQEMPGLGGLGGGLGGLPPDFGGAPPDEQGLGTEPLAPEQPGAPAQPANPNTTSSNP